MFSFHRNDIFMVSSAAFVRGGFSSRSLCQGQSVVAAAASQTTGPRLALPRRFHCISISFLLSSLSLAGSLIISTNSFISVLSSQDNAEFKKEKPSHHFILL